MKLKCQWVNMPKAKLLSVYIIIIQYEICRAACYGKAQEKNDLFFHFYWMIPGQTTLLIKTGAFHLFNRIEIWQYL